MFAIKQIDRRKIKHFLDNFLFPGVVLHEIAHYIAIHVFSTTTVEDVKIARHEDSYVSYKMYKPRVYKTLVIGLAPFYVNTMVSVLSIYKMLSMDLFAIWYNPIVFIILYYVALVTAVKSLPSTTDIANVFQSMKNDLFTNRFFILIFLAPIYLSLTIPAYALAKLRMVSVNLYYGIGISYGLFILFLGTLAGIGIIDPQEIFSRLYQITIRYIVDLIEFLAQKI